MDNRAPETRGSQEERDPLEHEVHERLVAEQPSPKERESRRKAPELPVSAEDPLAFLRSLAEASAVFVGFTFMGGWSYLASYYSTFGLNPLELDLPVPVVCTTAVYVLYSAGWPLLSIAAFSLGWIFCSPYLKRYRRRATAALLVLLLFTASSVGVLLGRQHAADDMLAGSSELPDVAFSSKIANADEPPCVEYQTYGSLDCKLLLHSKGTYYFFTPIPKPQERALMSVGSLNVYTLADSDVTGVHLLRGLDRNAREK